jgi:hypothetical protein
MFNQTSNSFNKTTPNYFSMAAKKTLLPQHVNLTKDEGKKLAQAQYDKLLEGTRNEMVRQFAMQETKYEEILKKKEQELKSNAEIFKQAHAKYK